MNGVLALVALLGAAVVTVAVGVVFARARRRHAVARADAAHALRVRAIDVSRRAQQLAAQVHRSGAASVHPAMLPLVRAERQWITGTLRDLRTEAVQPGFRQATYHLATALTSLDRAMARARTPRPATGRVGRDEDAPLDRDIVACARDVADAAQFLDVVVDVEGC
jgi:hypothetical protein